MYFFEVWGASDPVSYVSESLAEALDMLGLDIDKDAHRLVYWRTIAAADKAAAQAGRFKVQPDGENYMPFRAAVAFVTEP